MLDKKKLIGDFIVALLDLHLSKRSDDKIINGVRFIIDEYERNLKIAQDERQYAYSELLTATRKRDLLRHEYAESKDKNRHMGCRKTELEQHLHERNTELLALKKQYVKAKQERDENVNWKKMCGKLESDIFNLRNDFSALKEELNQEKAWSFKFKKERDEALARVALLDKRYGGYQQECDEALARVAELEKICQRNWSNFYWSSTANCHKPKEVLDESSEWVTREKYEEEKAEKYRANEAFKSMVYCRDEWFARAQAAGKKLEDTKGHLEESRNIVTRLKEELLDRWWYDLELNTCTLETNSFNAHMLANGSLQYCEGYRACYKKHRHAINPKVDTFDFEIKKVTK